MPYPGFDDEMNKGRKRKEPESLDERAVRPIDGDGRGNDVRDSLEYDGPDFDPLL